NDDDSDENGGSDDHDDDTDDERMKFDRDEIPDPDPNQSNEEHDEEEEEYDDEFNIGNEETMYDDEDDEVTKELHEDVNVNLGNKDANMTNADQGGADQQNVSQQSGFKQKEEDAHVTLTPILETQKTGVQHENTSATTIHPPPPFFNPLQQEATLTPTPTTFKDTTSFTSLLDFAHVFKFKESVTNLEKDMLEIKQVNQYAQALSSIPAVVNHYMDNKHGDAINKAIQANNFDCRKEAQAEKREYIE
nr:hypothetical protein [Tanacetum cinerariifolium]